MTECVIVEDASSSCLADNTRFIDTGHVETELLPRKKVSKTRYPDSRWSWVVCFAGFLSNLIIFGFSYSYGLLFPILLEEFKEGKAKTAWLGSLAILSYGIYGPVAGKMCDRFGPRAVAMFGGLLCAVGAVATSQASSLNIMFLTYGTIYGLGASLVYISSYIIVPQYFVKRRSLAMGILCMGLGGGLLIISPFVQFLLEKYSWQGTFIVISIFVLGICFLALTFDPNVAETENNTALPAVTLKSQGRTATSSAYLLRNRLFLIYTTSSLIVFYGHYVPFVHMVRHCEDLGINTRRASQLYLYSGLASLIMRPLVGRLCDVTRITPGQIYQVAIFGSGVASLLLPIATRYYQFVLYFVVYGITDGAMGICSTLTILSSLSLTQRSFGFGIMQSVTCISAITGPVVAGLLADHFGSYYPAFYMSGVSALLAASVLFFVYCVKDKDMKSKPYLDREKLVIVDKLSVV